jgi:hypothetical protein
VGALYGCTTLRGTSNHDFFVMFFSSGNVQLSPEAKEMVQQAAVSAKGQNLSIGLHPVSKTPR